MSNPYRIRRAGSSDFDATRDLVRAAFNDNEPDETVLFLDALRMDQCILGEWLAEDGTGLLAHIVFSRVWIDADAGSRLPAAMLTPLAVRPGRQRRGIGTRIMTVSLECLEASGEDVFLVLGHPTYYPRAGFDRERARRIASPWGDTPAFMARCATSLSGRLVLAKPIADAH